MGKVCRLHTETYTIRY